MTFERILQGREGGSKKRLRKSLTGRGLSEDKGPEVGSPEWVPGKEGSVENDKGWEETSWVRWAGAGSLGALWATVRGSEI